MGLCYMLVGFRVLIPFTFLSVYAAQELMMPYEAATRLIVMVAVSDVFGTLVLGDLSDILGRVRA